MPEEKIGITPDGEKYDLDTGEVSEGKLVWVPDRPKSGFGREFFLMTVDALSWLADHRKLIGEEGFAVFGKVLKRLDFENFIQLSQAEIARELNMQPSNVSRAMKRLISIGIIGEGPKVGKSKTYRLHPEVAWRGKPKAHFKAREAAKQMGWELIPGGQSTEKDPNQAEMDL